MTVTFNPVIPSGTYSTLWVVNSGTGVTEEGPSQKLSNGTPLQVYGPQDVPTGTHYIALDFVDSGGTPYGYQGAYATVTSHATCISQPNRICP